LIVDRSTPPTLRAATNPLFPVTCRSIPFFFLAPIPETPIPTEGRPHFPLRQGPYPPPFPLFGKGTSLIITEWRPLFPPRSPVLKSASPSKTNSCSHLPLFLQSAILEAPRKVASKIVPRIPHMKALTIASSPFFTIEQVVSSFSFCWSPPFSSQQGLCVQTRVGRIRPPPLRCCCEARRIRQPHSDFRRRPIFFFVFTPTMIFSPLGDFMKSAATVRIGTLYPLIISILGHRRSFDSFFSNGALRSARLKGAGW